MNKSLGSRARHHLWIPGSAAQNDGCALRPSRPPLTLPHANGSGRFSTCLASRCSPHEVDIAIGHAPSDSGHADSRRLRFVLWKAGRIGVGRSFVTRTASSSSKEHESVLRINHASGWADQPISAAGFRNRFRRCRRDHDCHADTGQLSWQKHDSSDSDKRDGEPGHWDIVHSATL